MANQSLPNSVSITKVCSIEGCESTKQVRAGLCTMHYCRQWRHGSANIVLQANERHGESDPPTPEYQAYSGAKSRCNNDPYYVRQGVQFRFESYHQFLAELGRKPTNKHTLDRINTTGHYEPGNVRWATYQEQAVNRINNACLTLDGVTHRTEEWSRALGLAKNTVRMRLVGGWCLRCAVTLPIAEVCVHRDMRQRVLTYQGETLTVGHWTRKLNLPRNLIYSRLKLGWTIQDALTIPARPKK